MNSAKYVIFMIVALIQWIDTANCHGIKPQWLKYVPCAPIDTVIDTETKYLVNQTGIRPDTPLLFKHIIAKRCPDTMKTNFNRICLPTAMEETIKRIKVDLHHRWVDRLYVTVNHTKCEYLCDPELDAKCNRTLHNFSEDCDCECIQPETRCGQAQFWNNDSCACECRKTRTCYPPLMFNSEQCVCEPEDLDEVILINDGLAKNDKFKYTFD